MSWYVSSPARGRKTQDFNYKEKNVYVHICKKLFLINNLIVKKVHTLCSKKQVLLHFEGAIKRLGTTERENSALLFKPT